MFDKIKATWYNSEMKRIEKLVVLRKAGKTSAEEEGELR